jgi:hypothetical protein
MTFVSIFVLFDVTLITNQFDLDSGELQSIKNQISRRLNLLGGGVHERVYPYD